MANEEQGNDSYKMLMGALDVFNEALDQYREKPVIKSLISLIDKHAEGRKFGVAVYDSDPDKPFDYFTLRLHNKRLELAARGKYSPDIDWKASMDYLKDVNQNSEDYIRNPLKLDFDWLKDRLKGA